jgi:predicted P-loop ATPase
MTHRIPAALLEQIKERVPISRLVGEYVAADKHKSQPGDLWGLCPVHKERTPSFHAEDAIGRAHCFGCGFSADHFEFVERMDSLSFRDAVAKVGAMAGITVEGGGEVRDLPPMPVREAAPDPYAGYEFIPAPADAQPIIPGKRTPKLRNPKKGTEPTYTPEAVYPYYNADGELVGYDLRVIIEGTKLTPTILWARNGDWQGWCHGRLPKMPILGLEDVLRWPEKQVLVVEGGKCRDAAREALQGRVVVVSWCGGTNSVKGTDWSPLAGRSLILWPDHDEGGYKAMHEVVARAKPKRAKWVRSYPKEKGADVADLISDGLSPADYIKDNISETPLVWEKETDDEQPMESPDSDGRGDKPDGRSGGHGTKPKDRPPRDDMGDGVSGRDGRGVAAPVEPDTDWQSLLQYTKDGSGLDRSSLVNAALFLEHDQAFKGVFVWNDFSKEISLQRCPPWERYWAEPRLIKETDITSTAMQMEFLGLKPKRSDMAAIISQVAEFNRFNPVVDALNQLQWDGVPRLMGGKHGSQNYPPMSVRYFGTDDAEINAKFFCKTMIAAVARAYQPGCKHDTALILEGEQGAGKSTAIEILSDAVVHGVYTDEISDPGSKDAGLQIQGRWIVEISELDAFRRSETSTIKSWISRKVDKFRRPYGKVVEDFLRCCIFIGSVNPPPHGYLKDPTGARRFWPVRVHEIDIPLLKEDARQLWAEARQRYLDGEAWYMEGDEVKQAEIVQAARLETDPWAAVIDDYLGTAAVAMKQNVKTADLMGPSCLNIPAERRMAFHAGRIEAHLNMRGWRKVEAGVYKRPTIQ